MMLVMATSSTIPIIFLLSSLVAALAALVGGLNRDLDQSFCSSCRGPLTSAVVMPGGAPLAVLSFFHLGSRSPSSALLGSCLGRVRAR